MNKHKTLVSALALALFSLSLPVRAQSPCKKQPVQDLARAIGGAYEGRTRSMGIELVHYVSMKETS